MSLTFGFEGVARIVDDAPALLLAYRDDSGADYLDFEPSTPAALFERTDHSICSISSPSWSALERHICATCDQRKAPILPVLGRRDVGWRAGGSVVLCGLVRR